MNYYYLSEALMITEKLKEKRRKMKIMAHKFS